MRAARRMWSRARRLRPRSAPRLRRSAASAAARASAARSPATAASGRGRPSSRADARRPGAGVAASASASSTPAARSRSASSWRRSSAIRRSSSARLESESARSPRQPRLQLLGARGGLLLDERLELTPRRCGLVRRPPAGERERGDREHEGQDRERECRLLEHDSIVCCGGDAGRGPRADRGGDRRRCGARRRAAHGRSGLRLRVRGGRRRSHLAGVRSRGRADRGAPARTRRGLDRRAL